MKVDEPHQTGNTAAHAVSGHSSVTCSDLTPGFQMRRLEKLRFFSLTVCTLSELSPVKSLRLCNSRNTTRISGGKHEGLESREDEIPPSTPIRTGGPVTRMSISVPKHGRPPKVNAFTDQFGKNKRFCLLKKTSPFSPTSQHTRQEDSKYPAREHEKLWDVR